MCLFFGVGGHSTFKGDETATRHTYDGRWFGVVWHAKGEKKRNKTIVVSMEYL